jgi:hypothetical protein
MRSNSSLQYLCADQGQLLVRAPLNARAPHSACPQCLQECGQVPVLGALRARHRGGVLKKRTLTW